MSGPSSAAAGKPHSSLGSWGPSAKPVSVGWTVVPPRCSRPGLGAGPRGECPGLQAAGKPHSSLGSWGPSAKPVSVGWTVVPPRCSRPGLGAGPRGECPGLGWVPFWPGNFQSAEKGRSAVGALHPRPRPRSRPTRRWGPCPPPARRARRRRPIKSRTGGRPALQAAQSRLIRNPKRERITWLWLSRTWGIIDTDRSQLETVAFAFTYLWDLTLQTQRLIEDIQGPC
ncbi:uncharacterized protein [Castor canadensis]|uniref:Uncharacterized protein n=1 Tax=Castor canadensis TaxID=51338 RepID=A0AC58MPI9_CASCN